MRSSETSLDGNRNAFAVLVIAFSNFGTKLFLNNTHPVSSAHSNYLVTITNILFFIFRIIFLFIGGGGIGSHLFYT